MGDDIAGLEAAIAYLKGELPWQIKLCSISKECTASAIVSTRERSFAS
jgi:hypothetical protein